MTDATRSVVMPRPRAVAWVVLLASAGAVFLTGLVATSLALSQRAPDGIVVPSALWLHPAGAAILTLASMNLRTLRWIFLLRRAETRIPLRDAFLGYLAGFALLLAPLFLGEIALRAWILRARGDVPTGVTAVLSLWERWFDLLALASIGGVLWWASGERTLAVVCIGGVALFACFRFPRVMLLNGLTALVNRVEQPLGGRYVPALPRLLHGPTTLIVLATSVLAWTLPAFGFWLVVSGVPGSALTPAPLEGAALAYVSSTLRAGVTLAPAGVVVSGSDLFDWLAVSGVAAAPATLIVLSSRLATVGVSTALGLLFVALHLRTPRWMGDHFDEIAHAYQSQLPEERRRALLTKKSGLMRDWLERHQIGTRGLDIGCGAGWYVERMRHLGCDVSGIDLSEKQIAQAARYLGDGSLVRVGSALQIPAASGSLDFAYAINVLHHLPSVELQRDAFTEILRTLRPGGVFFLHEINTTNVLFRFHMGYVFPSLNCIDEGIERWLLPGHLSSYAAAPVVDIQYFTFSPEFLPQWLVRWLAPLERLLERSPLRVYSAHYMAVLRKPE